MFFGRSGLPEILVRFGEPVEVPRESPTPSAPKDWTRLFEERLAGNPGRPCRDAMRREPADFETLLRGGAGQGGIYDWWRATQGETAGREIQPGARTQMNLEILALVALVLAVIPGGLFLLNLRIYRPLVNRNIASCHAASVS